MFSFTENGKNLISLYIPCYNASKTIGACLEHLLNQTVKPTEILVVDDGSTDNTVEIAKKYPVRIIRHTKNLGLAMARNTGVQNAKYEFVASIDADCLATSTWLEELIKGFKQKEIVGICGKLLEKYNLTIANRWRASHMKQHWGEEPILNPRFLFGSNTIFRKSALVAVGLYNPTYTTNYEDVDISIRLKNKGFQLFYQPSALVYHVRQDSISSLMRTFWNWTFYEWPIPNSFHNLLLKIRYNRGVACYFLKEDIAQKKYEFLFVDFLLFWYLNCYDLKYFFGKKLKLKI